MVLRNFISSLFTLISMCQFIVIFLFITFKKKKIIVEKDSFLMTKISIKILIE